MNNRTKLLDEAINLILDKITKTELCELSGEPFVGRKSKAFYKEKALEKIGNDRYTKNLLYEKHNILIALTPKKVEEILKIAPSVRKKLEENRVLKPVKRETVRMYGKTCEYSLYDFISTQLFTDDMIREKLQKIKEKDAKKIKKELKEQGFTNKRERTLATIRDFYIGEYQDLLDKFAKRGRENALVLELAYWTMWVNRLAKTFQLKEMRAKKIEVIQEHRKTKDALYNMKHEAFYLLSKSSISKLRVYKRHLDDKMYADLCDMHRMEYRSNEDFVELYFNDEKEEIMNCPNCTVEVIKDMFAFYTLDIEIDDFKFSFHCPYDIGRDKLPDIDSLKHVFHIEKLGDFKFGRALTKEETTIFTKARVVRAFNKALIQLKKYQEEQKSEDIKDISC